MFEQHSPRFLTGKKPGLDAIQDAFQMGFGHPVVDFPPLPLADQEPAALHEPQVLGGHILRNLAVFGDLPHVVAAVQQQLHGTDTHRMRAAP